MPAAPGRLGHQSRPQSELGDASYARFTPQVLTRPGLLQVGPGLLEARLRSRIWFEYVPSEQNIADLPSRGKFGEMHAVMEAVRADLGVESWGFRNYEHVVLPDFSTWCAPLASIGGRACKRSGSRGARRKRKAGALSPSGT